MQVIAGVYLVMLVMFHCLFRRCELSKWSKCIKNMTCRCWQQQNCIKLAPTVALESPTVVAFPFVQMPWAVAFQDLPCPSHPFPSNGITAADVFFWVAGSLGRSLKVDVMFHDNRLHLRSAGEWDRLKSCHIPHIHLSYDMEIQTVQIQRCLPKKKSKQSKTAYKSIILKKCHVVFMSISSFAVAPKRHTPTVSWPNRNDPLQRHHWWPHALAHPRCLDWLFLTLVVMARILEKIIARCHSFSKKWLDWGSWRIVLSANWAT